MSTTAQVAVWTIGLFIAHLILCIFLELQLSDTEEKRLQEKNLNKVFIKKEIERFHRDFYSGSAITPALNVTCLKVKTEPIDSFEDCKTSPEKRLKYSVGSTTLDDSFKEYNVEDFCASMEKHRQCMQKQAVAVCGFGKPVSIKLPLESLCRVHLLDRIPHTWYIILVDVPFLVLLILIFLVGLCLCKGKTDAKMNGQLNGQAAPEGNSNGRTEPETSVTPGNLDLV